MKPLTLPPHPTINAMTIKKTRYVLKLRWVAM